MTVRFVDNPLAGPLPAAASAPAPPDVRSFHRRLPGYAPTPLVDAPALAKRLGVGRLLVKCELERFGLPAFKMLGASWAAYRALGAHLGRPLDGWDTIEDLARLVAPARPLSLAAATDGNHGRAVARMARWLGLGARIFVPEGMASTRVAAIESEGAEVVVVDGDYDDAVAAAAGAAGARCIVISDVARDEAEPVPRWVVEGYATLFAEVDDALTAGGMPSSPDLVAVPIGVGSLAAAAVVHWAGREPQPLVLGVEPTGAACAMAATAAGRIVRVPGPHDSVMAGLNCGTVSSVAWPLLAAGVDMFVAIDDDWASAAQRDLVAAGIAAGETGAAALAGFAAARQAGAFAGVVEERLARGTVLVLCTEGVTDVPST